MKNRNAQRSGQLYDDFDSRIANSSFNPTQVGAVEVCLFCESVLGKSSFVANTRNVATKGDESFVPNRHLVNHAGKDARSSVAYRLQCSDLEHAGFAFLEFFRGNFIRVNPRHPWLKTTSAN